MIVVSEKSRTALVALVELANHNSGQPVPIVEVAEARGVPLHVVEQLFGSLRRAGILQSQRGMRGGYSFRRPPSEVTVLDVVEAVDGELTSPDSMPAVQDAVWREAIHGLAGMLGGSTVAELAHREAEVRSAPMFHI
ncbi:MAG: Rrf2 family transcriptional regulator [Thermoleophilia bacterium]|nr:Rrf2 family transcriptional regulator [Thermoleophilia bacterium]MDH3724972.1 Rrf2 family transcriptional regulator [Thermoleophilia bacterium]